MSQSLLIREALCGRKGRHQSERRAWRGGSAASRVTLGGRQIDMPRLRARSDQGELGLSSFRWAASRDPLNAHTLEAIAAGVSTRRYARTLDPLPAGIAEYATSSSAVSRRFVALSSRRMREFLSRPSMSSISESCTSTARSDGTTTRVKSRDLTHDIVEHR